jgi:hypothetical protein
MSFFFLKNFNDLYFFYNFYNKINFNLLASVPIKTKFLNKNLIIFQINFNKNNFKKKQIINYKLNRYFLSFYTYSSYNNHNIKKNWHNIIYNLPLIYTFNNSFINFFYNYCFKKKNFIILNDDYHAIYPLYKFMFGINFLHIYKNFFFLKPINFTFKNWLYFFSKFCKYNNVCLMFVFDYDYYINFYKNIKEVDLSVSAIVPFSYIDDYIDYPLYSYDVDVFVKLIYSSYIFQIYSLAYNSYNLYNQYKYIQIFYKFYFFKN